MPLARSLTIVSAAALALTSAAASAPGGNAGPLALQGDINSAHDPVLIRAGGTYYSYSTGRGHRLPLAARASSDLIHWHELLSPLPAIPAWALAKVPDARDIWAPDISKVDGRYRLYYAVSTFGSQTSVIGLATSASLDPSSRDYGWKDEGLVLASSGKDDFNAIDPNFVVDAKGRQWLAFGSYWSGLKLVELDPATGKPMAGSTPIPIAARGADHGFAIEAPFIVQHAGYYYLLASFDHCCQGVRSDYKVAVGRAQAITGPYVDQAGVPMLNGGGTIIVSAGPGDRFRGPGHQGHLRDRDGREWLVYHAYDSEQHGTPALRIARLTWDAAGWPVVAGQSATERINK